MSSPGSGLLGLAQPPLQIAEAVVVLRQAPYAAQSGWLAQGCVAAAAVAAAVAAHTGPEAIPASSAELVRLVEANRNFARGRMRWDPRKVPTSCPEAIHQYAAPCRTAAGRFPEMASAHG